MLLSALKFFLSLGKRFRDITDPDEKPDKTRQYLYTVISTGEADRLLAVYETYLKYQRGLHDKSHEWGTPMNAEDSIRLLCRLQEYR